MSLTHCPPDEGRLVSPPHADEVDGDARREDDQVDADQLRGGVGG